MVLPDCLVSWMKVKVSEKLGLKCQMIINKQPRTQQKTACHESRSGFELGPLAYSANALPFTLYWESAGTDTPEEQSQNPVVALFYFTFR